MSEANSSRHGLCSGPKDGHGRPLGDWTYSSHEAEQQIHEVHISIPTQELGVLTDGH